VPAQLSIKTALCLSCQRRNEGLPDLPQDIQDMLQTVHIPGYGDVPQKAVFQAVQDETPDPLVGDRTSVRSVGRDTFVRRVFGKTIEQVQKMLGVPVELPKEAESKRVAKEKKTKRIFSDGIVINERKK
jgi:hypothetical protein